MTRRLRIAAARLFHEACVGSPLPTTLHDFERLHYFEGAEVGARLGALSWELDGLMPWAELSGLAYAAREDGLADVVPLVSAFAVPSGKLTRAAWDTLTGRLLERLDTAHRSAPLDGVFLALHGSMRVEGLADSPETTLVETIRARWPHLRIAATFDLHCNLNARLVAALDVVQSFRANPHWDLFPTGLRAARTLIRTLRGGVRPVHAFRKLPVVLGGGAGVTLFGPIRRLFRQMMALHRQHPRVLHTSINFVHPFSDADDIGWSVHVSTDDDPGLARVLADLLAETTWAIRKTPLPAFRPLDEALDEVRRRALWHRPFPSTLVDMGDGVLSGASGGSTFVLRALLARQTGLRALVPLHDPALVAAAMAVGTGERLSVEVRGTPGLEQEPVAIDSRVFALSDTEEVGRQVHLDLGDVQLVASERPPLSAHPRYFRTLGIDPRAADLILQKSFFQYRPLYLGTSHHHVPLQTPGPSDLHAAARRPLPLPTWPSADPPDWRPFSAVHEAMLGPAEPSIEGPAHHALAAAQPAPQTTP